MKLNIKQALDETFETLSKAQLHYGHGTDNAWDEAVQMVLFVAHLPLDSDEQVLKKNLNEAQIVKLKSLIKNRIEKRVPLPYLTQEAWFAGLKFFVDERVIIPRSPFAEWIEKQFSPWVYAEKVQNILDLCTGSACMAIAAAYAFPNAKIDAVDISPSALEVAEINVKAHHLDSRLRLQLSDGFKQLPEKRYDIIMSNPPYVGAEEMESLPTEFRYEPELALKAEAKGLAVVHHILEKADRFLTPDGILIVEVGNSDQALIEAYPQMPFIWLEQERGGHGLFLLTKSDLAHVRK